MSNPLNELFLKLLITRIVKIDKYKLNKFSYIGQSYLGNLLTFNFIMHKYGPLSEQIQNYSRDFKSEKLLNIENKGKITDINTYKMLSYINEFRLQTPNIVNKFEIVIIFLKIIEDRIRGFPDKELFASILYFIHNDGINSVEQLYNAIRHEKGQKFSHEDFRCKCKLLKDFCLIKISGDNVSLDDNPFDHLVAKLLKPSNHLCSFFERNTRKITTANKEFLMRNYKEFKKYYRELKKSFSQLIGNGLN